MNLDPLEVAKGRSLHSLNKKDFRWALSLYGTAIGAGILFLPIQVGISGLIPVLLMALLAFPMTFLSHRNLSRFVLSGNSQSDDVTNVVEQHFGKKAGNAITFLYFFSVYPILLVYSVSLTNNVYNLIVSLLGYSNIHRWLLALILISGLMLIVRLGQDLIIRTMSLLVFPFIAVLLFLSLAMIPFWSIDAFKTLSFSYTSPIQGHSLITTIWLTIPLMVFSFNHSPIISAFSKANREKYQEKAEMKCSNILFFSTLMMVFTALLFVFSCIFTLSPEKLMLAKSANISILDYLSIYFKYPPIKFLASVIAFVAIIKSFLGHYLGVKEGINGLLKRFFYTKTPLTSKINFPIVFIFFTCWGVASWNPSVLNIIERFGGPIIALLLFIMPLYGIYRIPALKHYRNPIPDMFVGILGAIAVSASVYSLIS